MQKLTHADLWPLTEYERIRDDFRRSMIEYKKTRRVDLGDRVTLVFENRKTMKAQIMEMLRAEHIRDEAAIQAELDVYNELIPGDSELVATMFIAFSGTEKVREEMPVFLGLDRSVWLVVNDHQVQGRPEEGRSEEERISSVQYLRFPVGPKVREALHSGAGEAALELRHPKLIARAELPPEVRESLAADLEG